MPISSMKTTSTLLCSLVLPLLLWLAALIVPINLVAQTPDTAASTSLFMVGLSGGVHQVKHTFGIRAIDAVESPFFGSSNNLGWCAGINGELRLHQHWSVNVELLYNDLSGKSAVRMVNPSSDLYYGVIVPIDTSIHLPPTDTILLHNLYVSYSTFFSFGLVRFVENICARFNYWDWNNCWTSTTLHRSTKISHLPDRLAWSLEQPFQYQGKSQRHNEPPPQRS